MNITCNNINEVSKVMGIEASRRTEMTELTSVLSFDGGYIDSCHPKTLTGVMTLRGEMMSVTRHGLNRADTGPPREGRV